MNKYSINKYIIFNIFIFKVNNNNLIKIKIMWKIYIINGLKAKMLININIIKFKKINIIILIK